ncbi:MAG TPA: iron ABC transporter permease [Roseomonas sp.]|nr:iron ABC transporter permease [Roseomonas sp.]
MSAAITAAVAAHRARERRRLAMLAATAAVLAVSLVLDLATGPALLPLREVVLALSGQPGADETVSVILWSLRLPMALMALVVGVALGVSGATMQTLLDNPLASPYTLGLAAAAGFGASLAIQYGGWGLPPVLAVPGAAFLATCLACAVILGVGRLRGMAANTVVLAGIALLFLFHALQSLMQFRASPEVGQQIVFWLLGSLAKADWHNLAITAAVTAIALPLLMRHCWALTTLRLGEARARALGVPVAALRLGAVALISLMTATAIAFVGTIGFVGLVAPHLARLCIGEDQRFLLPLSGLMGALMLSSASVLSKVIIPGALVPVGVVTAVIGVPFFLWLILARRLPG